MTLALRSVKRVCSDRVRPSRIGMAAQMSGTPSSLSCTKVARRPALTLRNSS